MRINKIVILNDISYIGNNHFHNFIFVDKYYRFDKNNFVKKKIKFLIIFFELNYFNF